MNQKEFDELPEGTRVFISENINRVFKDKIWKRFNNDGTTRNALYDSGDIAPERIHVSQLDALNACRAAAEQNIISIDNLIAAIEKNMGEKNNGKA